MAFIELGAESKAKESGAVKWFGLGVVGVLAAVFLSRQPSATELQRQHLRDFRKHQKLSR